MSGSPRRQALLEAAYAWVGEHGWADLSLRPLAEAIGSSPRVLLFLFGSKDGLIEALLARSRAEQLDLLERLRADVSGVASQTLDVRDATPLTRGAGLADVGERVWTWLADPARRGVLRLWLGAYSRSLGDDDGPWAGFAARTVADWDALLARHQERDDPAERALLLAVLRGALLDLLATGDAERLDAAVATHLRSLRRDR